MTTKKSRRTVLAGIAATPAVIALGASTAVAAPVGLDDPIFAAIEACRAAEAANDAMCIREDAGEKVDHKTRPNLRDARQLLARTIPATPAGLAALTGFVREQSAKYEEFYFDEGSDEPRLFLNSLDVGVHNMAGLTATQAMQ